jgi:hypothetical protein
MTSMTQTAEETAAPVRTRRKSGLSTLLCKGAGLAALTAGCVLAICIGVPDGNDYAKASVLKHTALDRDVPRQIVLVGGSNLAFGVDSTVIRKATGCPVVNMGMNGYFGPKFMLSEVKPNLRPGDVVVIAWEYDNYYKTIEGTSDDLLMVTKSNPSAFAYLDLGQIAGVIGRYPYVAQQKVLRLMTDARALFKPQHKATGPSIEEIESLAGFTKDGDLTSHLGVQWTKEREQGIDLVNTPPDRDIVPLMVDFATDVEKRGVAVMISFTPVIQDFYVEQRKEIDRISAELAANPKLKVPRPASEFVFPSSQHFDTVYHLNAEGRAIRSRMLADDIIAQFGDRARCGTQSFSKETHHD